MDDKLISLLETLGYDVIKQGTLDVNDTYPQSFFTYYNWQNPRDDYYDNKHHKVIYYYQIQFYTEDMKLLDETVNNAVKLLEENGFELEEEPTDNYSDIPNYKGKNFEIHYEARRN